jgi:hypothetical protein
MQRFQLCRLFQFFLFEAPHYYGCYLENLPNRLFNINPGNYDPSLVNPIYCSTLCARWNYQYAAINQGQYCFCSPTLPTSSAVSPAYCAQLCGDGSADQCGDFHYISVYLTEKHIEDLAIASSSTLISPGQSVTITGGYFQAPATTVYQLNFNDGSGWFSIANPFPTSWIFAVPGEYLVTVEASEATGTITVSIEIFYSFTLLKFQHFIVRTVCFCSDFAEKVTRDIHMLNS